MTKLGFIGFGLIGASIAKSLKSKASGEYEVYAYDYHKDLNPSLEAALKDQVIVSVRKDFKEILECDIVFLCAPTLKNIEYLKVLKEEAEKAGKELPLITDVGSVKGNIVSAAKELGLGSKFIGGHPMAGSEKTGYESANDHLLENAYYILTPALGSTTEQLTLLESMVKKTGAIPIILDCEEHDRITAVISHVPHIVAVELVNLMMTAGDDTDKMKMLAAGGFKDITRVASSSPEMWKSIFLSNKEAIVDVLEKLQDGLVRVEAAVISENGDYIFNDFAKAGEFRNTIPNSNGMYKKSNKIFVDVQDEVGAIAKIAQFLTDHSISIKNIGIVHNRESDPGALRVDFYDSDAKAAASKILEENGYTVFIKD